MYEFIVRILRLGGGLLSPCADSSMHAASPLIFRVRIVPVLVLFPVPRSAFSVDLLFNFMRWLHRRLADGDVHCAAIATYQIFLGYRSRTLTRSLILNPKP